MEITIEGLFVIIGAAAGATMWIVSAIYGVRDSVKDLASALRADIDKHDSKIKEINEELDDVEERLSSLEGNK